MLRLTNMADYAVVILVHAARAADGKLNAATTAQATGVPAPTVSKVLSALTKAGLVTSQRGAAGGYVLARPLSDISIADIIEAVDGPIALTTCADGGGECGLELSCAMRDPWKVINRTVRHSLHSISLASLASSHFKDAAHG
jgi:FeS assembly SUF system regulator